MKSRWNHYWGELVNEQGHSARDVDRQIAEWMRNYPKVNPQPYKEQPIENTLPQTPLTHIEEQISRQLVIDETNTFINRIVQDTRHTFTNLTLSDWDKRYEKQFIYYTNDYAWSHLIVDTNNKQTTNCYDGMPSSFENYYEEGKVPFLTKCPTCKSPTKFNYMNKQYRSACGNMERIQSSSFKEVYCNKHYFYDSSTNKHYIADISGIPIQLNDPKEGFWSITSWRASDDGTHWKEWDPLDPDGSNALAEKKRKEVDETKEHISILQAKLSRLTSPPNP